MGARQADRSTNVISLQAYREKLLAEKTKVQMTEAAMFIWFFPFIAYPVFYMPYWIWSESVLPRQG